MKAGHRGSQQFARDVVWVGLSQLLTSLFGFFTLPLLAKSYPPALYGIWAQASVTVSLFSPLLTLHFGTAANRFLAGENDGIRRNRTLVAMLAVIAAVSGAVALLGVVWAAPLSRFLFARGDCAAFVRPIALWMGVGALFLFLIAYLRAKGQIRRLAAVTGASALCKIAGMSVLALSGAGLAWILYAMAFIELGFVAGMLIAIVGEEGFGRPDFSRLRSFLAFSLPQIPLSALLWIISASDRYFITHFLGLEQAGIYTSSHSLGGLITFFYYPIAFVLLPIVSRLWDQGSREEVRKYLEYSTRLFLTLAIAAVAGITLLSQPLLNVLATSRYLVGWKLVLLVASGSMFLGVFQINLYIIYLVQQTRWLPLIVAAASGVSVALNVALIPRVGIFGAAVSNIVAYGLLAAIVVLWANRVVRCRYDFLYLGKVLAAAAGMAAALSLLPLAGIARILLAVALGALAYGGLLFLLRAFSEKDRQLIRDALAGLLRGNGGRG